MLKELRIRQLGLADDLMITPGSGLTMLTGETGAGKSMIAGALSLLLGKRADRDLVREGAARAIVEGVFDLNGRPDILGRLDEMGLEAGDDDLLLLRREISAEGRGRVMINGRISSLPVLEAVAAILISVQSQNQQTELLAPEFPLNILDDLLECIEQREALQAIWKRWRQAGEALAEARRAAETAAEQFDIWQYQHQELVAAGLEPDEEPRLRETLAVARHAEVIRRESTTAYEALVGGEHDCRSSLGRALSSLKRITGKSQNIDDVEHSLQGLESVLSDAAQQLERLLDAQDADPQTLQELEDRLALYEDLQRKYRQDISGLCLYRDMLGERLKKQENSTSHIRDLSNSRDALAVELRAAAEALHIRRSEGAEAVAALAESMIRPLALPNLEISFSVTLLPPDEDALQIAGTAAAVHGNGADRVDLMVRTNRGERLGSIGDIASGGELSRIYLGLLSLLRQKSAPPVLLLDEADSGLGNDAALPIGQLLRQLAVDGQVICITHLPAMAAHGDKHWQVGKSMIDERTVLKVTELNREQRIRELARMLGGTEAAHADPQAQIKYASDLLMTLGA
jgi:DNA repair protein RecN (Recombination protein N)